MITNRKLKSNDDKIRFLMTEAIRLYNEAKRAQNPVEARRLNQLARKHEKRIEELKALEER